MNPIDMPSEKIAAEYTRWRNNRDAVKGVYAVKLAGDRYMPKPYTDITTKNYESFLANVSWYPAVSRTVDGIVGLMMRKVPALEASGLLQEVKNVITIDGRSVDELARDVVRETLVTNYTGLLVDMPQGRAANVQQALDLNLRPFVGLYPAESILEVTPGVVANRRVPVRVRLLENQGNQVRELRLNAALEYEVVLHTKDTGGQWTVNPPVKPLLDSKPMREIPFVLVTTTGGFDPLKAPIDDAVMLNFDHYRLKGLLTTLHLHISSPMLVATGISEAKDVDQITISPGNVLCLENHEAKVFYVEPSGDGIPSLEREIASTEDRLAVVGARILARQKAVAEAAETEALRQGAENATLASLANAISHCISNALKVVSRWNGDGDVVQFQLNTDFTPIRMDPQEMAALLALFQADLISEETLFLALRDRGVLNETLTIEEERKRKLENTVKPAPVVAAPVVPPVSDTPTE